MCVAFFTLEHPNYALILCSNRDEDLARPTKPASFHTPDVLSGIDVQAGGTWLGLNRTGKLALLTNITEPAHTFASSRGHLVASFLSHPSHAHEQDVRELIPPDVRYAGFNLVLLSPATSTQLTFDALYVTNHGAGGEITYRPLSDAERRCSVLSNGVDGNGADEWPKVQHGMDAFHHLLDGLTADMSDEQLSDRLFDLLTWRSPQPPRDRSELRNTIEVEPIGLGSVAYYATRVSTVVLISRCGDVVFIERDRWQLSTQGRPALADPCSQRVCRFKV